MRKKFIFVTGGVLSSLGKGVSAAAIGALLKARGIRVANLKMDPYINVDPGTMSPYQHGEVFVTDDGYEADLDLGHYERFTQNSTSQRNAFTAGRIYRDVIERERRGEYLGHTVQVIPHITDEIKSKIWLAAEDVDLAIVEVGGTVGDIEGLPFLEAIRQFRIDAGPENVLFVHVTLVPYIRAAGELKSKPTQHSIKELLSVGIQADILLCRAERDIPKDMRQKIALFCNVAIDSVISAPDLSNIYQLPLKFHDEGLDDRILNKLGIWAAQPHLEGWADLVARMTKPAHRVRIGIVGKYVHLVDTYKSLNEALVHGGVAHAAAVDLVYIDSEELDVRDPGARLRDLDGVLVPGGFGDRGAEGKIAAVRWAREQKVPYFGICLGLQVAVIEYCRNVLGLSDASSREFNASSSNLVIELMDSQQNVTSKGGTMRLGAWPTTLSAGSVAQRVYGATEISERHRHRYEVNPGIHAALRQAGMVLSGLSAEGRLVEMIELPDHPYFVGCQFHPEFKSRPLSPHPLFAAFVRAALAYRNQTGRPRTLPESGELPLGPVGAEA